MKKILLCLILVGVILISGCEEKEPTVNKNLERYHDDSFFVQFNDQREGELIASISNENFQSFFNQDLNTYLSNIHEVEDIFIDVHQSSNLVYIKIEYVPNLTKEEKYATLNIIIESIKYKWYIKYINYDPIEVVD